MRFTTSEFGDLAQSQLNNEAQQEEPLLLQRGSSRLHDSYKTVNRKTELPETDGLTFPTPMYQDSQIEGVREALERKLIVRESDFTFKEPFTKSQKGKLGQLFYCNCQQKTQVCRVMDFDRITSYQMESCFT